MRRSIRYCNQTEDMYYYFKPWRRRIGVITLAIACALTAAWVRSLFVEDFLGNSWFSRNGALEYVLYESEAQLLVRRVNENGIEISSTVEGEAATPVSLPTTAPGQPAPGFGRNNGWWIPYWSIVAPLILLSAFLLLSRTPNQQEPTAPTA